MAALEGQYADALLDLSVETGRLDQDLEEAVILRDLVNDDEVQAFLSHPQISDREKLAVLLPDTDGPGPNLSGLLQLMVRKDREKLIAAALTEFITAGRRLQGKIEAKVVSYEALSDGQLAEIGNILSQKLKLDVSIRQVVDPDVIGGFYILADGYVYDATIRTAINKLKQHLQRSNHAD